MTSTTLQAGYPVRLTGELDPNLSRWLWLVKMFLAIPHYVILAFYPRSLASPADWSWSSGCWPSRTCSS